MTASHFQSSSLPEWLYEDVEVQRLLVTASRSETPLSFPEGRAILGDKTSEVYRMLADRGAAEELRLSFDLELSTKGRQLAERVERAWASGTIRQEFAQLVVLDAASKPFTGVLTAVNVLAIGPAETPLGPPLTVDDLEVAIDTLGEAGLVKRQGSWGGPSFVVAITSAGRSRLAQGLGGETCASTIAVDHRTQNTVNVHGDNLGNVAAGNHVSQTSHVAYTQALEQLDQAIAAAHELPSDIAEAVSPALEAARQELARPEPEPRKASGLLKLVKQSLELATSEDTAVANVLAITAMVLQTLGMG